MESIDLIGIYNLKKSLSKRNKSIEIPYKFSIRTYADIKVVSECIGKNGKIYDDRCTIQFYDDINSVYVVLEKFDELKNKVFIHGRGQSIKGYGEQPTGGNPGKKQGRKPAGKSDIRSVQEVSKKV